MRVVIGGSGEVAPGSSVFVAAPEGVPTLGGRELLPNGVPTNHREISSVEIGEMLTRYRNEKEGVVALLHGRRALPLFSQIMTASDFGILIFDHPVHYVAGRLALEEPLSKVAQDWIDHAELILRNADGCEARPNIFNAAEMAAAPNEFTYFCDSEFGIAVSVKASKVSVLERTIATQFISSHDRISDLTAELMARCTAFSSGDLEEQNVAEAAVIRLGELRKTEKDLDDLRQDHDLLSQQLGLVQYKAEQYYKAEQHYKKTLQKASSSELAKVSAELAHARHEVAALKQSTSWKVSAPVRWVSKGLRRAVNVKSLFTDRRNISLIRQSDLFDASWYLKKYPDVANLGIDPAKHFFHFGAKEGRSPSGKFSVKNYLRLNPDVTSVSINPLVHYLKFGRNEGRAYE